jgi:hypothetical protein
VHLNLYLGYTVELYGELTMIRPRPFISYAEPDGLSFAERLYTYFISMGIDAWMYRQSCTIGAGTWTEIATEIQRRNVAVIIVTKGSRFSTGQKKEINMLNNIGKPIYVLKEVSTHIIPEVSWVNHEKFSDATFSIVCQNAVNNLSRTILQHQKLLSKH